MTLWDSYLLLNTPKLQVPTELKPTRPHDRGWLIPFFAKNKWWTIPLAIVPAVITTILIFMDQQITAVIINRKEFKLKVNKYKENQNKQCVFFFAIHLEKSWLSSRFICFIIYNFNTINTWFTMVCSSNSFGFNTC